jgi:hypothetical protein
MTSKQYIAYVSITVTTVLTLIISINLYFNFFGLFSSRSEARIWVDEKTSKYLLSFRYIPENFDWVLIGPSVSANLDTRNIKSYKIYNLSMAGANISEIKYAIDNVLNKGNIQYLVICLYPYLTKNSGLKGRQINEKEYWGSLYSLLPIRILAASLLHKIFPGSDIFHASEWGYNDTNLKKKHIKFSRIIVKKKKNYPNKIFIDPIAYKEFQQIIKLARAKQVKILAYYFPIYYEFSQIYKKSGAWNYYQAEMNKLFNKDDLVWDMNLPEYEYITHNKKAYIDGHLSNFGADLVVSDISKNLHLISSE